MTMVSQAPVSARHEASRAPAAAPAGAAHEAGYLIFRLGAEGCGIDILRVHDVCSWEMPMRTVGAVIESVSDVVPLQAQRGS